MLVKGLPRDALVRTPAEERGREPWTAYHELLAQLIELTSVTAADHRIKKPLKVPRPQQVKAGSQRVPSQRVRRAADVPAANPYSAAIAALGGAQPSRKRALLAGETGQEMA